MGIDAISSILDQFKNFNNDTKLEENTIITTKLMAKLQQAFTWPSILSNYEDEISEPLV